MRQKCKTRTVIQIVVDDVRSSNRKLHTHTASLTVNKVMTGNPQSKIKLDVPASRSGMPPSEHSRTHTQTDEQPKNIMLPAPSNGRAESKSWLRQWKPNSTVIAHDCRQRENKIVTTDNTVYTLFTHLQHASNQRWIGLV